LEGPLALSGVVFAVLLLIGWFASGGDAPDYGAAAGWRDALNPVTTGTGCPLRRASSER
jgi:hypothetical protein